MLSTLFYTIFILYFVVIITHFTGLKIIEIILCTGAVLVNLIELILLYKNSGNLPLFNIFESFLLITFIMGGTGLLLFFNRNQPPKIRLWVWIEILILFLIMVFFPKEASPPVYDHGYSYIVMFHAFRCLSLASMLIAATWYVQFIIQREFSERTSVLSHQGRNYLLLATVFFLTAEYVGIIWCQKGWGDFWMWSQTFFQSTMVVIYLMLAFHIPGKNHKSEDIRSIIGGLSGVFFLTLALIRSFY